MDERKEAMRRLLNDLMGRNQDKPEAPEGEGIPEETPAAPAYTPEPEITNMNQGETRKHAALRDMLYKMHW